MPEASLTMLAAEGGTQEVEDSTFQIHSGQKWKDVTWMKMKASECDE